MKKKLALLLSCTLLLLCACGAKKEAENNTTESAESTTAPTESSVVPEITDDMEYGIDFASTWGDLYIWNAGELPRGGLSDVQYALIVYPKFDRNNICYDPDDVLYHSVRWCYMLDHASSIEYCDLAYATDHKMQPCDKCIRPIR